MSRSSVDTLFFFFNDTATTEIYTLSLHDALPIYKCKKVFIMSRYHDLKNREIAEKLNITVKAVEKHISKALKDIRTHLLQAGYMSIGTLILSLFSILPPPV